MAVITQEMKLTESHLRKRKTHIYHWQKVNKVKGSSPLKIVKKKEKGVPR